MRLASQHNILHQQNIAEVDKLVSKGHISTSAVAKVLRNHNTTLQDLFDTEFSYDEQEETDDDFSEEESQ